MIVFVILLLPGFMQVRWMGRLLCTAAIWAKPEAIRCAHSTPLHHALVHAQLVAWYIFSRRIARNMRYGPGPRQHLDLYWPPGASRKVASIESAKIPVVIYITGIYAARLLLIIRSQTLC